MTEQLAFSGPFPELRLVPGDSWRRQVTVVDKDGVAPDLSGWWIEEAFIEWGFGNRFSIDVDMSEAASGVLGLSAAPDVTVRHPMGRFAYLTVGTISPGGFHQTIYYCPVHGVSIVRKGAA